MPQSIRIIKVAVLADELLGWGSGKHYFKVILDNYSWKKDDVVYQFVVHYITDKEILDGKLQVSTYDVLLVPGGGVGDGHAIIKGFTFFKKVRIWKNNIAQFIKQGGGYVGICGGAALLTDLTCDVDGYPKTILERLYNKSSLKVSLISSYYKCLATPLFYLFQHNHPEKIGAASYVFSFSPGKTREGERVFSAGVPIDCDINTNHPIFHDCQQTIQRMRWWGGPAFLIPNNTNRSIQIIARYPKKDFSNQKQSRISAWIYTGGLLGLIKGFFHASRYIKKTNLSLKHIFLYSYFFSGNWKKSEKQVELNFSNKPCMTTEIFPNENKGRILLCGTHPEYMIWKDGYITEDNSDSFHCIANGFHQWKDISPYTNSFEYDLTYTWWLVRRIVAWSAKIPDKHLPKKDEKKLENSDTKTILTKEIFWDGDIQSQIKNI